GGVGGGPAIQDSFRPACTCRQMRAIRVLSPAGSGRSPVRRKSGRRCTWCVSDAPRRAIAMSTTVKDVMTTHVVAVRLNATYKDMATRLREFRVSAFPVLDDDDKVVGVVSEADMLAKEALEYSVPGLTHGILHSREKVKAAAVVAADLMTKPAVTIGPREP